MKTAFLSLCLIGAFVSVNALGSFAAESFRPLKEGEKPSVAYADAPLYRMLGKQKVRIMTIGAPEGFRTELSKLDFANHIDHSDTERVFFNSDMILIFVESLEKAMDLDLDPYFDEFLENFASRTDSRRIKFKAYQRFFMVDGYYRPRIIVILSKENVHPPINNCLASFPMNIIYFGMGSPDASRRSCDLE